ncbi:Nitrogen permease regulator 3 [Debaryomyces fabryi]|uniref:Nitrogen permease regulator 3 n=1 Tax=Debaryomyces fabryi TaxID=58627 RepID=A0A0V1Q291_9ASCO|nr:Nitrogen permease regulator 3 [Debaryomyces fabryi]KSA02562.1 Nitrogen permease regulator 3 [Debaryomyces fabryi]CUM55951.1 unnamed protein product [Debaryomyces fabryi]
MSLNLPNPSILGILLVVSTHSGPQLVFQYPPDLSNDSKKNSSLKRTNKVSTLQSRVSDTEDDIDDDDYIADKENDEEYMNEDSDEREWDSRKMNYYLGTKKDLLLFLDEQEKFRQKPQGWNNSHSHEQTNIQMNSDDKSSLRRKSKPGSSDKQIDSPKLDATNSNNLKKTISSISDSQKSNTSKSSVSGAPPVSPITSSTILGFEADYLCEMLCPPKQMCNSRFEIMIDDLVFLGLPIHSYDNGSWRSKHSHRPKSGKLSKGRFKNATDNASIDNEKTDYENTSKSQSKNAMNMFHLVFIMNPPIIECNYRIDEMFHYVISRLSLVLRYEQLKHEYVWNQIRLIYNLKEEFRNQTTTLNLTRYLTDKSSLCKLISDCFIQISRSNIANLSINNKLRSFQIPIKTEFHSLPDSTVPYLPGSHLSSTVNMLANTGLISVGETVRYDNVNNLNGGTLDDIVDIDDNKSDSNADDIIYYALLLLDDPETIIRDIKAQQQSTLANFIRMIKPTESLLKLANKLKLQASDDGFSLDVGQIKSFAFHLIYWRRARVILPIGTRSVYIVSPMAPITLNFHHDIFIFKRTFPALPSLPHFLKLLSNSSKPRQLATIIPSKDHRDAYLNALSWLIRYGYVTQLHTFIWLKISRKVKMKVEEDLENESANNKRKKSSVSSDPNTSSKINSGTDNTSKTESNQEAIQRKMSLLKIVNKNTDSNPNSYDQEIDNIEKKLVSPSTGINIVLEEEGDTIIIDPGRASSLERRWINKVISEECSLSSELTVKFYDLLKYMNGKNSLELLLLKENVSRQELRKLLFAIEDHIISVRHW